MQQVLWRLQQAFFQNLLILPLLLGVKACAKEAKKLSLVIGELALEIESGRCQHLLLDLAAHHLLKMDFGKVVQHKLDALQVLDVQSLHHARETFVYLVLLAV